MGFEFGNPKKTTRSAEEIDELKNEALADEPVRRRREESAKTDGRPQTPKSDVTEPESK